MKTKTTRCLAVSAAIFLVACLVSCDGVYMPYMEATGHLDTSAFFVSFDANGGSGLMGKLALDYGASAALPANAYTRTGYTFLGWSAVPDATAATYADKASYTLDTYSDVTLYAVWE